MFPHFPINFHRYSHYCNFRPGFPSTPSISRRARLTKITELHGGPLGHPHKGKVPNKVSGDEKMKLGVSKKSW